MKKIFIGIIVINMFLSLLFVYSNYVIWNTFNSEDLTHSRWNPILINYTPALNANGSLILSTGEFPIINFPFLLFWLLMGSNLYFMRKLAKK